MKDLRKYIHKVANEHKEHVDNDALWAGIERKMKKPKKDRRFILFLIWGISFSFVALAIVSYNHLTGDKKSMVNNIEMKSADTVSHKLPNKLNSQEEIKALKLEPSIDKLENSSSDNNKNKAFEENEQNNGGGIITNRSITSFPSSKVKESQNNLSNDYSNEYSNIATTLPSEKKNSIIDGSKSSLGLLLNNFTNDGRLLEINIIASSLNIFYNRPKIDIPSAFVPLIPMPSKTKKNLSFLNSLTIYTQYGFGNKTVQGDSDYGALRNESEELLEQLRIGIESDLIRMLDFTIYGGASYVSINDRVSVDEAYYEDQELTYLKIVIISPGGNEKKEFATKTLPHLINNRAVRHNSHKFVSMPVGMRFGKEFSKLYLGIGFGLDFNYYISDTHTILSKDNKLTTIPVGGKWLSPSIHTAITVEYPISDQWYIHSKIMYRNTSFKNMTIESDVQESYRFYGLDLGVKLRF